MSVNGITNTDAYAGTYATQNYSKPATETATEAAATSAKAAGSATDGVIYEASGAKDTAPAKKTYKADPELVAKLKADAEARTAQLRSLVEQLITKQGQTIGTADDMYRFLAKGDFEVDPATRAQAQADIAEDGYWGVKQTSERIFDFAKALSGGDPDKMDEMLEAFKKGFEQATKTWGSELPDISQRTYDAVLEKFEAYKNGETAATESAI